MADESFASTSSAEASIFPRRRPFDVGESISGFKRRRSPSPEFDEEADRKRQRMLRTVPSSLFALPGSRTASTSMLPPPARAPASNPSHDSLTPSRSRLTGFPSASAPPLRHSASFTTFEDLYGSTASTRTWTRHPELTIWESKTFREKLNATNPDYVPPTLSRSQSVSSLRSSGPPELHEASTKHHLQKRDVTIDFNPPVSFDDNLPVALACSKYNILFFPRRNRIFYKKLSSNDVATQLCKVKDDKLTAMAIGAFGLEGVESIAIASRAGLIEIWDIETMQKLISFSTKAPTALTWDGPVLTVGNTEGSIRHYDTRLDKDKMKKGSKVIKYHKAMITRIAYNFNTSNHMFASGDVDGNVLVWNAKTNQPINAGDLVPESARRLRSESFPKEIKHTAPITAISWAPWNSKLFAAGDKNGLTRAWVVDPTSPISDIVPGRVMDYGTRVVSIHWSCNVKEFLTVHGEITSKYNPSEHGEIPKANTVVSHHYPSLYEIHSVSMGDDVRGNIYGSTMNRDETKIILAVPRPPANPPPTEAEIASAAAANAVQAALAAIARATRNATTMRASTTTTTGATPTLEAIAATTTVSEGPAIVTTVASTSGPTALASTRAVTTPRRRTGAATGGTNTPRRRTTITTEIAATPSRRATAAATQAATPRQRSDTTTTVGAIASPATVSAARSETTRTPGRQNDTIGGPTTAAEGPGTATAPTRMPKKKRPVNGKLHVWNAWGIPYVPPEPSIAMRLMSCIR
ncbi:uncharacterized protein ARMOST_14325 [Armillaria ostoyae]|uniref:Uncharacterized protein n=1 Tax=Armillaria ostoyae TaxID=47428 RepID=A0A284RQ92_ARMOS|nr:uncharacterized protein ARMOST_14325 [Armillaria ostoyae]